MHTHCKIDEKSVYLSNYNIITMNTKTINQFHSQPLGYETPSMSVADISFEGVLCASDRDFDYFDVLPEQDW